MDDYMSYDEKQGVLMGKETKRKLSSGDDVRVRITAVSLGRAGSSGKIGVTARQPSLGKLDWLKADAAKTKEALAEKEAESKKEKSSAEKKE
jgi:DNA-directed RNA polymerase subunit E'